MTMLMKKTRSLKRNYATLRSRKIKFMKLYGKWNNDLTLSDEFTRYY